MPFRLTNALAIFQQLINQVLYHKLNHTIMAYLDNILVYTKETKEKHEQETKKVLQLLEKHNICLNDEKSKYTKIEVIFLGTIISKEGLRMELEKTKAVRD